MLPLKQTVETTPQKNYYEFIQNPQFQNWLWLIAFSVVCVCNGWFLRVSSATFPLVIYFAIFPLAYILYEVFNSTRVLKLSLIVSWAVLAFAIGNLHLPSFSTTALILYGINVLLFVFVLIDSSHENGLFMPVFIGIVILLLLKITDLERILRLVWYCNLMTTANKAGVRLNKYFQSYLAAMMILTTTAALGLAIGWVLGGTEI